MVMAGELPSSPEAANKSAADDEGDEGNCDGRCQQACEGGQSAQVGQGHAFIFQSKAGKALTEANLKSIAKARCFVHGAPLQCSPICRWRLRLLSSLA